MKKKVYIQPKLINLGSVAIQTLSTGLNTNSDSGNNMMGS